MSRNSPPESASGPSADIADTRRPDFDPNAKNFGRMRITGNII
jgi:hypothetical protein